MVGPSSRFFCDQRRPDDVHAALRVHRHGRSIVGTPFEHPFVLADAKRGRERPAAIPRRGERDVADVARVDVAPCREDGAVGSRGERGLAAVAHAAGEGARRDGAIQRRQIELRPLCHRDAVRLLIGVRARLGCSCMIVVRCGDRAVLLRQLAMIEPHGVDAPVAIGDRVLPAPVAGCIAAWHRRRPGKRPAAVGRSRRAPASSRWRSWWSRPRSRPSRARPRAAAVRR